MCIASDREFRTRISKQTSANAANREDFRQPSARPQSDAMIAEVQPNDMKEEWIDNSDDLIEYELVTTDNHEDDADADVSKDVEEDSDFWGITKSEETIILECDLCGWTGHSKIDIEKHMRRLHRSPYCKYCDVEFDNWLSLHLHRVREDHYSKSTKVVRSTTALNSKLSEEYRLQGIVRDASHQADLVCEVCGKVVKTKQQLAYHLVVHQDPSTFEHKCELCGKRFGRKCSLDDHRKRHMNIRKFTCVQCNAHFVAKNELRQHMTYHKKVPTESCPECEKKFNSKREY